MLKRNKAFSIVMTLCLCLALLAPVFVAAPEVQAATYSPLSAPAVDANSAVPQALGVIQVDIPSCAAVKAYDTLTVSLPSEVVIALPPGPAVLTSNVAAPAGGVAEVFIPATLDGAGTVNGLVAAAVGGSAAVSGSRTSLDITFMNNGGVTAGRLFVYLRGVMVGSIEGDITAQLLCPSQSAFSMGTAVIGKATSAAGNTGASVLSVKTFGSGGGNCDIISVWESKPGVLKAGEVIKVKLPTGFTWGPAGLGSQFWGWATNPPVGASVLRDGTDPRILNVTINGGNFPSTVNSGRVGFAAPIVVDDSVAKKGDIEVHISSNLGNVTESDLIIAKYGDFGVKVVEGTKKDLIAGKHDQKVGTFYIEEEIVNSLIGGRNIKFTLPQGVKWSGVYRTGTAFPVQNLIKSSAGFGVALFAVNASDNGTTDTGRTIRTAVTAPVGPVATAAKIEYKDFKVDVAPDFVGPITLTVSGTAGAAGEVVIGEVKPAVELKADSIKDVRIGEQQQALGDLIITETKKENIALNSQTITVSGTAGTIAPVAGDLTITLPGGAEWGPGYPTVEVTEGDLQLKTTSMSKNAANNTIIIPVKSESTKPSTIKVSGMKATLYRTVPEGEFKLAVAGTAVNETGGTGLAFPQFEANKVVIAKCVTPAPDDGTKGAAAGQFKIGSNIYEVNGVSKVMDAAPYVKNSRTYVPVRYLGYALGVAEADVVWDAATQKVTLTKGENVVELTIGSTTITVNGEAKTMDVAPEISSDRTMLPARYVAEGLGYEVGWDPGTQTVLISAK